MGYVTNDRHQSYLEWDNHNRDSVHSIPFYGNLRIDGIDPVEPVYLSTFGVLFPFITYTSFRTIILIFSILFSLSREFTIIIGNSLFYLRRLQYRSTQHRLSSPRCIHLQNLFKNTQPQSQNQQAHYYHPLRLWHPRLLAMSSERLTTLALTPGAGFLVPLILPSITMPIRSRHKMDLGL